MLSAVVVIVSLAVGCGGGGWKQKEGAAPKEVLEAHVKAIKEGNYPAWEAYYSGRVPTYLHDAWMRDLAEDTGTLERISFENKPGARY